MAVEVRSGRFSNTPYPQLSGGGGHPASFDLIRLGAHAALLAGAGWLATSILTTAMPGGRGPIAHGLASLNEALYLLALVGSAGGVIGLHARQSPTYGRLGAAGSFAAFTGITLLLVGLAVSSLSGGRSGAALLDPVLAVGLWLSLLGFPLIGIATLRLRVLPQWCGVALIVSLPAAIALGDFGGGALLGLLWLSVGYALLSQHDVSALLRSGRK